MVLLRPSEFGANPPRYGAEPVVRLERRRADDCGNGTGAAHAPGTPEFAMEAQHIRICKHCASPYDWRRSASSSLKMTYCGSLCEKRRPRLHHRNAPPEHLPRAPAATGASCSRPEPLRPKADAALHRIAGAAAPRPGHDTERRAGHEPAPGDDGDGTPIINLDHIKECARCGLRYDWRRSPSSSLKMTYCGSLCERAALGFTIRGSVAQFTPGAPYGRLRSRHRPGRSGARNGNLLR